MIWLRLVLTSHRCKSKANFMTDVNNSEIALFHCYCHNNFLVMFLTLLLIYSNLQHLPTRVGTQPCSACMPTNPSWFRLRNVLPAAARTLTTEAKPNQDPSAAVPLLAGRLPVTYLTEDEQMMKEMVAKFAKEQIKPLVRTMDDNSETDMGIIQALFDNGVRCKT